MQGSRASGMAGRDLDPTALAVLRDHGAEIMRSARRHAANREDAEDAFQRGFEILLTSAPDLRADELVPWLKTVVKHEAYALRRARERQAPVTGDGAPIEPPDAAVAADESAESRERGLQGAEALARLKPQEVRALVLKARGLSYREIGDLNGWTYTKVNRLLTEGRRSFRQRLAGIQAGAECERMEPLLSLLADSEASAEQLATLRPHLKTCLSCRARLRQFRSTPDEVAALAPAFTGGGDGGRLRTVLEGLLGIAQGKSAIAAERVHALTEMAVGQKLAAVAAAAAVTGGGAAVDELASPAPPPPAAVVELGDHADAGPMVEQREPPQTAVPVAPADRGAGAGGGDAAGAGTPAERAEPPPARPDPASEFDPSGAAAAAAPGGSGAARDSEPGASSLGAAAPGTSATGGSPPAPSTPAGDGGGSAPATASSPPGTSEFAP